LKVAAALEIAARLGLPPLDLRTNFCISFSLAFFTPGGGLRKAKHMALFLTFIWLQFFTMVMNSLSATGKTL